MATLPIYLEVEDVAVGPVLIALRKMPGIIKMNLDIGAGAPTPTQPRPPGANNQERVTAFLMQRGGGPLQLKEVVDLLGNKGSAYTAIHLLKKNKVIRTVANDRGNYELTDKARRELMGDEAVKLLPKPHAKEVKAKTNGNGHAHGKVERAPSGRAAQGAGRKLLLDALAVGDAPRLEITKQLAAHGMSVKSVSGIFDRAKRDKLIKKDGDKYHLTAEGIKKAAEATTTTTGE